MIDNQNILVRNQQVLESKLDSKTISDDDLSFISNTLIPLIKDILLSNNGLTQEQEDKNNNRIKTVESIVSTKLLKVLQTIDFNIIDAEGMQGTSLIENSVKTPEK